MPTMPLLSLISPLLGSAYNLRQPVVDHHHVPSDDAAAEAGSALILAPDLGADRLAWEDGRGEACRHASEPRRVVAAQRAQQRMAGDAEGAEPMQDRPRKAGRLA